MYRSLQSIKTKLTQIARPLQLIRHSIGAESVCTVCEGRYRFGPFGDPPRPEARCPKCGSLERHRLLMTYLRNKRLLETPIRLLHFAPEGGLCKAFRRYPIEHVTADLNDPATSLRLDIRRIALPEASFDAIICVHVLEHIDDDISAMRELRRVIKPSGWAIINVPFEAHRSITFEDPSVLTPEARQVAFGQWDHVRLYGTDYSERLRNAGWNVTVTPFGDLVPNRLRTLHRLPSGEDGTVFLCRPTV